MVGEPARLTIELHIPVVRLLWGVGARVWQMNLIRLVIAKMP